MRIKILFSLLLGVSFTLSCSTTQRKPNALQGRHLILTLHGVRGTEKSFGDFHRIIKTHLDKVDPGYFVIPVNFTYPTGQDNYDPNHITASINKRIWDEMDGMIHDNDKISAVGYSMGGQVMAHWYMNTMMDPKNAKIAEATKSLIGLGAPFWGSKHAIIGAELIADSLDKIVKAGQMSGNEVRALSLMSDASVQLREKMIAWQNNPEMKARFKPRILSIAGIYPCFGKVNPNVPGCGPFKTTAFNKANQIYLEKAFSGLIRRETDMVVIVPSARLDFLYYKDGSEASTKVNASQIMDISQANASQFHLAESLHAGDGKIVPDMVIVGPECQNPSDCKHGTYRYMFEALAGCKLPGNTCVPETYNEMESQFFGSRAETDQFDRLVLGQLHGFFLEMVLRLPTNYQMKEEITSENLFKFVRFHFANKNFKSGSETFLSRWTTDSSGRVVTNGKIEFQIGRNSEISSRLVKVKKDSQGNISEIRLTLTGRFSPAPGFDLSDSKNAQSFVSGIWAGPTLPLEIHFPGLKSRQIEARVKPTASTYLDLTLSP